MAAKVKVVSAQPTPFWTLRLAVAEELQKRGLEPFSDDDVEKAREWQDCACGKQDRRIPRWTQRDERLGSTAIAGAPKDKVLFKLGCDFSDKAINTGDVSLAKKIMAKIERRSALILSRLPRKVKK